MIELTKKDLDFIISSGNLYYSLPKDMLNGYKHITSNYLLDKTIQSSSYYDEDEYDLIFTYWNIKENKPLFDIIISKDFGISQIKYYLSDYSLFGMYWLISNKLGPGMENMIYKLKLNVPSNIDLVKYTKNNFKIAMLNKDFI